MSLEKVFAYLVIGLMLTGSTRNSHAATALAIAGDPLQMVKPTGTGTLDLQAHTDQTGPPRVGPNADTFDTGTGGAANPIFGSGAAIKRGGKIYTPIVGIARAAKPTGNQSVRSTSDTAQAVATYTPSLLLASAMTGLPGEAAALADDPYPVPPGLYPYAPVIDFALNTNDGAGGGTSYSATDSRFDGLLWSLSIGGEGPITSSGDLSIEFFSQPILGLDDDLVMARVRSAITVSGGTAAFSSFQLFNTTYRVDQTIQYGQGVEADVATPEPSTLILLGLGGIGLVGYGGWRRALVHNSKESNPNSCLGSIGLV